MKRLGLWLGLLAAGVSGCFDPLYQDGDPLTSGWVVCCKAGVIATCFCPSASSCVGTFYPCAGNRCAETPSCPSNGSSHPDAGDQHDAGSENPDGGTSPIDGGSDAGTRPAYEVCCTSGVVATCACPAEGCPGTPFTPCGGGACVPGTTTSLCR